MSKWLNRAFLILCFSGWTMGCVHHLDHQPNPENLKEPIVTGQIQVWQAQPSGRIFLPEIESLEFVEKDRGTRYLVEVGAPSSFFFLSLAPGHYQVSRVFLREGEFRARAEVPLIFEVPEHGIVYLGKWRFQVGSPNFMRHVEVKVSSEPVETLVELRVRYPSLSLDSVVSRIAQPGVLRIRMYETTPYPRFRWFNRQNPT